MLPSFLVRQNEERELGVTDVSSHREFIMNSVTEAPPADVALIRVPADGNFTPAIAKGNHSACESLSLNRHAQSLLSIFK